jgi:rare lipoprotein A
MMAGIRASRRTVLCVLKTAALVGTLSAVCAGAAVAQAPIVYKSMPSGSTQLRLENRADPLALNIAPKAPVPTFADGPVSLRPGAAANSFGPTPLAAAGVGEPLSLKIASTSTRSAIQEQLATPYAGPPYQVNGRWYVPAHEPNYNEVGIASWYGPTFHGKDSASGEVFDENAMTAAHPTLPIPSLVRVTNLDNGRTVVVRVNDRGPFVDDRIIDLSKAAGAALDMHAKGTAKVRVEYVGAAPLNGGGGLVAAAPAPQRVSLVAAPLPMASRPTVAAPVAATSSAAQFYVQAGSFADLGNAHALRQKLAPQGGSSIETVSVNGSELYRVMLGPWLSRDQAEAARQGLSRSGAQGLVVSRTR